jgi:hypothetical protein
MAVREQGRQTPARMVNENGMPCRDSFLIVFADEGGQISTTCVLHSTQK